MRARALITIVLLGTACSRSADLTGPSSEHTQFVVTAPTRPSFVVAPVTAPAGLAACWTGDGNALDIANGNHGTVSGAASFATGKFGQAFSFDALGGDVRIPASATLNVGAGDGLTFSVWIFPKGNVFGSGSPIGSGPIMEFEHGAQLWQHLQSGDASTGLFANLAESDAVVHFGYVGAVVHQGEWNHVAVTYAKSTGVFTLYANGAAFEQPSGIFTPNTASTFHIGSRVPGSFGSDQFTFNGLIDEVQIYNRALTDGEVGSLFAATGTLCAPQPRQLGIATQPAGGLSGTPLGAQPAVEIRDFSNAVVTAATNAVTAAIASGPGMLSGTTTVIAVGGVAHFTDLTITGSGNYTLSFTSTGLTSASSASFAVTAPAVATFKWQGFFDPIDNLPKMNKEDAGESIPVKFSLGGNKGLQIFTAGYPASQQVSCTTGSSLGPLQAIDLLGSDKAKDDKGKDDKGNDDKAKDEKDRNDKDRNDKAKGETDGSDKDRNDKDKNDKVNGDRNNDDKGGGGLKFDDGKYTFTWKTDKSWAGTCRMLMVKLSDGTTHTAKFSFGR